MLVPIVLAAVTVIASVLVLQIEPGAASQPTAAEPADAALIAIEQHGA